MCSQVVTGSYNNMFFVLNTATGLTHTVECDQPESAPRKSKSKKKQKKKYVLVRMKAQFVTSRFVAEQRQT